MSVIFPQVPAQLRRALGRFVSPAGAALFSLVLASCAGGGFGGAGDASDISGVNPVSQPAPAASGPISPASQRKVAEAVSGLDLGEETPPISPEDIAVSNDSGILDSNPFSSSAPAARSSGWGARADSTRKTQGYKAFEVAVPSENPLMTVAVWISETPPDYPEGKPEQDPEADRKFLYLRLQVFIEVGHVALVEDGGVEVLDSEVIVVEEKRPDPKPDPQPTVVAEPLPACGTGEFRDGEGSCSPILGADLLCPSGTLPANGLTQAELDAGLLSEARDNNLAGVCEYLRRGADIEAAESDVRYRRTALAIAANLNYLDLAKMLVANGGDVNPSGGIIKSPSGGISWHGGYTALHYASAEGYLEMVRFLLDEGANIRARWALNGRGVTPLYEASYWGRPDVVALLLSRGAESDGWAGDKLDAYPSALHAAVVNGLLGHGRYMYGRGGTEKMFSDPDKFVYALVVSVLLSGDADPNLRLYASSGDAPLDRAVRAEHSGFASALRDVGGQCFVETGPLCGEVHVAVDFSSSGSGTVSAEGDGEVLSVGGEVRQGATVMFTATPAAGHYVSDWSGNCADAGNVADGLDGTAKSCAVSADSDLSVRAEFSEIPSLAGPLCPSGSLTANGLTQAELNAGLLSEARDNDLAGVCEYLRRGADIEAAESDVRYRRTALAIAANLNYLDLAKMLVANGGDVNPSGGIIKSPSGGISWHGGYTALHYASAEGYLEMVRFLLDEGANIRARWALNGRGVTPLYEASYWGRPDVVALLLSRGAESDGWAGDKLDAYPSALHAAVVNGLLGHGRYMYGRGGTEKMFSDPDKFVYALVVSVLLSGDADPNLRLYASSGDAPLDRAVRAEHSGFASALRGAGGICYVETGPLCGEVHVAVDFSSSGAGTVSAEGGGGALSAGGEVRQGATVMFTATPAVGHYVSGWSGNCAEVGGVADGLDGTAKSCAASADSDLSVRAEFSEIPSLAGPLCPSGSLSANGLTQAELDAGLISAARDNDLEGVCEHLRRGANIEAQESEWRYHKRTALMIAATDDSLDLAKLLRANGADVNRQGGNYHNRIDSAAPSNGNRRMPALHYAAGAGHKDFAEWLLAEGADLHALQTIERGALWEAAFWGRVDIVKLFLSSGADVNARDMWGATPFLNAAHFPIYLARHEMPRWGVSDGYDRPLDSAWPTVLSLLVSSGAEVNVRYNSSGSSALDVAVSEGNAEYAELLRGYGVRCFVQTGPLCGVDVAVDFSSSGSGTVSAEGDGEVLSVGGEVRQGATVMFTAAPAAGHYVSGWSGNCAEIGEVADGLDGTAKSCAAAADSDLSVRAEFSEIPSLAGPLCPSGSLTANGLTQAQLDAGLITAARDNDLEGACEYLRRSANIEAWEEVATGFYRKTPLIIAGAYGRMDLARLLLDNGADVDGRVSGYPVGGGRYRGDMTALIWAAWHGHADMIELLLDRGAEIDRVDSWGGSPLMSAGHAGMWEAVEMLLSRGADANLLGPDGGQSALYGSVRGLYWVRDLRYAEALMRERNPALDQSWAKVVSLLLDSGAEVNARLNSSSSQVSEHGFSSLDYVARGNYAEVAQLLRNGGGKCFVRTGHLCGEVQVAVGFSSSGSGTVSAEGDGDALSDGGEVRQGATVVFMATPAAGHYVSGWSGNCAEAGEVADGLDGTAKLCAAAADSALSVRAEFSEIPSLAGPLCPSGSLSANGLTQAELDEGLLSAARGNNLINVCEYLRRGANIEAEDSPVPRWAADVMKRTPLVIAAVEGRLELARLLLDNGANVNWQSGRKLSESVYDSSAGWSALLQAAGAGHSDVVELLLDRGADINIRWDFGRTALHEAAIFGRASVVELLLDRGVEVDARDLSGATALYGAAWGSNANHHLSSRPTWEGKWDQVLDLLLDAGAEVNARTTRTSTWGPAGRVYVSEGWDGERTPLDAAVSVNKRSRALKLRSHGGVCNVESGPLCPPSSVAVGFSSSGSGTVSAEGDGDALSDGGEVRQGATVMFTATPTAGHYVSGWSGNCAEAGGVADGLDGTAKSCSVLADSALSVRAEFSEIPSLAGPLCPFGSLSANGLTQAELNMTLRLAARGGDAARACEALRRGADVNDNLDNSEFTPLQEAVSGGHLEAVKILLANGAEVNKRKDSAGRSPLDLAARDSEAEIAALLRAADGECFVETGPLCGSVPAATSNPVTVVNTVVATVAGTVAATVANTVVATVAAGSCPAGTLDANGLTQAQLDAGLILAAQENDATRACEHMRRGANVNAQDDEGGTPLHHTTRRSSVTGLLLDNGANINATDNNGRTPLHRALKYRNIDYWKTRRLLERGADADAPDGEGNRPMHLAIADGWYNVIRMLLDHGADIEGGNSAGETPLHRAAIVDKYNIVRLLADRGADLNSTDNNGRTPLHRAVGDYHRYNGRYIVVRNIIRRGADVNARGDDGGTPLDLATVGRIARLLTDAGGVCFIGENAHCGSAGLVGVGFSAAGSGEIAAHVGDRALTSGERVQKGVTVVFSATPGAGGRVKRWSGACAGIGLSGRVGDDSVKSCRVTVNAAVNAGVFFAGASVAADAPLSCPSGSLSADGLTQAGLNAGLVSAAQANNLEDACEYLRRGADVNARYSSSFADILTAMSFNERLEMARLLVANGADVDGLGHSSPLGYAAYFGYVGIARHLLENGANVNRKSHDLTPLDELADSRVREKPEGAEMSALLRSRGGVCGRRTHWVCSGPASVVYAATVTATIMVTTRAEDSSSPLVLAGDVAGETTVISSVSAPVVTGGAGGAAVTARVTEYFVRRVTVIPTTTTATIRIETVETENPGDSTSELIALSTVTNQSPPGIVVEVEEFRRVYERLAVVATVANTVAATVAGTVASTAAATAVAGFCPAGALDANGLTQAQLNFKLLDSAQYDNLEGVCGYLRRGADVDAADPLGMTPLLWATYNWADDEDVLMAELLLSRGADPNILENHGGSPLHYAAARSPAVMVSMLLASGAEVNALHGRTGRSPLDYAAAYATKRDDNRDIAALLRAAGGLCFLEIGPLCGNVPVATPDLVTVVNTVAATVVNTVAATVANTVVATVAADELSCPAGSLPDNGLTQAGLDQGLLLAVSWWGTSRGGEMCEYLRRGANVNAKEGVGWTPLHNAAWHRQRGAASLLIQNSANIDPKSAVNETPLHIAANRNAEGVAALLLANGADVHAKSDMDDETPLHFAARSGAEEVAALLLANGADIHAKNSWSLIEEETPLHVAAKERSEGVAALLLANGADVNAKTRWRKTTPLHYAAGRGSAVMVSMLLAGGADVNAEDEMHVTPLHFAVDSNASYSWSWHYVTDEDREEVVALLLANGADVNAAGKGLTPMDLARRRGKAAVLALLEAAANSPTVASAPAPAPAEADALTDRLRERFAGAFNPSPAFGDAFGAVSGSSESFLTRLNSLMRSSAGAGGNAWDSFGGWQRENEHGRMWFSTGQRGDFGFGAGGNGAGGDLSASPFAALVGNGMLAGGEAGLGADGKLRIAAFADYQAKSLLDGEEKQWTNWAARGTAIETAMTEAERFSGLSENRTRGAMTELHLGGGDLGVALQAGAVSESDSVLSGTAGNKDLRGLRSRTAFAGLSGAANLFGSGWRLRGSAHLGRSWAESEGMLRDSDLWASAFSAGLERGGWLYSDDGFVLRFSQPLRVENWDMELIGDDGAGRLGADASGRQLDVDAAYRLPLSGGGWLLLSAGVRRDGGHSSSSDLEAGALFSVERGF